MAKAHDVEDAIREGGGKVAASKLAAKLQKGKPLTGELKTIGEFANNFSSSARVPEAGDANPLTVFDFMSGALGAGISPAALALPAGRVASRYGILSQPYQRAFVHPQYGGRVLNAANKAQPLLPYLIPVGGLLGGNAQ